MLHERLFSHIESLPYISKQYLRRSNDFSEVERMLGNRDILKVSQAEDPIQYVFCVINSYMQLGDGGKAVKHNVCKPVFFTSIMFFIPNDFEKASHQCKPLRDIPTPKPFTSHLFIGILFWLSLLPLTVVISDEFVSYLYLVPIGYSIIKLVDVGHEMSDPFGTDDTVTSSNESKCSILAVKPPCRLHAILNVKASATEAELFDGLATDIRNQHPGVLVGFETQSVSIGFILERAQTIGRYFAPTASRLLKSGTACTAPSAADNTGNNNSAGNCSYSY